MTDMPDNAHTHIPDDLNADPEFWISRGDALQNEGCALEALACFRSASRLAPLDVEPPTSAAFCLVELGRWNEAAASYGSALRLDPGDIDLRNMCKRAEATAEGYRAAAAGTGVAVLASGGVVAARCAAPEALVWAADQVAPALRERHYAVVDGACQGIDTASLRSWLEELKVDGRLTPGESDQLTPSDQQRARDDLITSICVRIGEGAQRTQPPALEQFLLALDALVGALQLAPALRGCIPPSLLREERQIQATCYAGGSTGYVEHVDNPGGKGGRVLTCILYLNEGWEDRDGGELRLRLEPNDDVGCNRDATVQDDTEREEYTDVAPLDGRLVVFWSDNRVPHSVRAANTDRYAMSCWYTDAAIMGRVAEGVAESSKQVYTKRFEKE